MCKRSVNYVNYNSILETMATCSDIYLYMHMCVPGTRTLHMMSVHLAIYTIKKINI